MCCWGPKKILVKEEPADHALGRSRGGYGSKIHLICDKKGHPITVDASSGQAHESQYFESTMKRINIGGERGRPRIKPDKIAGDKAYSSSQIRNWANGRNIVDVIPTKENEQRRSGFDKKAYRQRNVIERCIGWLKESRRIATRFEKLAIHFLAMLKLGIILRYL